MINVIIDERVIDQMNDSSIQFELTGSRFFGNINPNSDWDFFTLDCEETQEFLNRTGFVEDINEHPYPDSSCSSVFLHPTEFIHVQLIKSEWMDRKRKANEFLREFPWTSNKHERSRIWNWALRKVV